MERIMSFSGGKDSTAMVLLAIENKIPVDEIIFADTGMEFPAIYENIEIIERMIGRKITRIQPDHSFEWYLCDRPKERGEYKHGFGWPWMRFRWCTKYLKTGPIRRYLKGRTYIEMTGYAVDEERRYNPKGRKYPMKKQIYPLVELNMTEADCLAYCKSKNVHFGGLYDHFRRLGCWCCPLQRVGELQNLYQYYPHLWRKLIEMDLRVEYGDFLKGKSIEQMTAKFARETGIWHPDMGPFRKPVEKQARLFA
jgi:3'-phosphoadenosine 5'-phosphosulfate sulfotransferase (PAPS reductase)/FAD synthetase